MDKKKFNCYKKKYGSLFNNRIYSYVFRYILKRPQIRRNFIRGVDEKNKLHYRIITIKIKELYEHVIN